MGGRRVCEVVEKVKPALSMVVAQVVFAGISIFYKLAINDGMDMRIMVAYRYIFAAVFMVPLAFFIERKKRPRLTWVILLQSFLCGLFGGALTQNMYIASMKLTSATFTSTMTNLVPAITFILALIFRLEKLAIRTFSGQAKIVGTLIGVGGAMFLTFYKGAAINLWPASLDLITKENGSRGMTTRQPSNPAMGSLLALASCVSYSVWLILQAVATKVYPCPYTLTAFMCSSAAIQSVVFALAVDRDPVQWRLGFDVRLLAVVYAGIIASALTVTLMAWCIRRKGPLYASVFNPLMLLIVALLSSLLLDEKLHVGSVLGAALIVIGLYFVLLGKGREAAKVRELPQHNASLNIVVVPKPAQESSESPVEHHELETLKADEGQ